MSVPQVDSTSLLVDRLRSGDVSARDTLIAHTGDRLRRLARRMLRSFPGVRRWEQTDDVLQEATLRLLRALKDSPPESARHYYALATLQLRRSLLDLTDKYQKLAASYLSDGGLAAEAVPDQQSEVSRPETIEAWTTFHRRASELPAEEQEVFDLIWYQQLSQEEAAEIVGVSVRTIKRRWLAARLTLGQGRSLPSE